MQFSLRQLFSLIVLVCVGLAWFAPSATVQRLQPDPSVVFNGTVPTGIEIHVFRDKAEIARLFGESAPQDLASRLDCCDLACVRWKSRSAFVRYRVRAGGKIILFYKMPAVKAPGTLREDWYCVPKGGVVVECGPIFELAAIAALALLVLLLPRARVEKDQGRKPT